MRLHKRVGINDLLCHYSMILLNCKDLLPFTVFILGLLFGKRKQFEDVLEIILGIFFYFQITQ